MNKVDHNYIYQWLKESAIVCRSFPKAKLQITEKTPGHCVTDLDYAIDKLLKLRIGEQFPGHNIISEEGENHFDPHQPYTWLLDPIDGTSYLIDGLKEYSVVIMLLYDQKPLVVGIINPELELIWLVTEDIAISEIVDINRSRFQNKILASPHLKCKDQALNRLIEPVGSIANRICIAVTCDAKAAISVQKLSLWDVLPGMFMAQRHGYCVSDRHGKNINYELNEGEQMVDGLVVARESDLATMLRMINEKD